MLKAVALAAREFPEMNGHWTHGSFHPSERVHPGLAISILVLGFNLMGDGFRDLLDPRTR